MKTTLNDEAAATGRGRLKIFFGFSPGVGKTFSMLQAGRAQIRDLLEAQNALLSAQNAVTGSLVDYHVSRLRFLVDVGSLDTGEDRFWVSQGSNLPGGAVESKEDKPEASEMIKVVTPSELFGK